MLCDIAVRNESLYSRALEENNEKINWRAAYKLQIINHSYAHEEITVIRENYVNIISLFTICFFSKVGLY